VNRPQRFDLPPDLLAMLARFKARKPRRVQREEYRARMLARAEANHRAAGCGGGAGGNNGHNDGEPGPMAPAGPEGGPPDPPEGVS
jgi:hypothetical protein